jgi:hypothetical protein
VPSALNADHATNADRAKNADHATSADSATNATTSTNADQLGGVAASLYPHTVREVTVATALNSVSSQSITASCDLGEKALGGGGWVSVGTENAQSLMLNQLVPFQQFNTTPAGYTVWAYRFAAGSGTWSVTARVICASGG